MRDVDNTLITQDAQGRDLTSIGKGYVLPLRLGGVEVPPREE